MFKLKVVCVVVLLGNICSAVNLNDVETASAFLRIPAVVMKNSSSTTSSRHKQHILNITVDLLRLVNETLSIINKNGEYEFHKYDYCWAVYDLASLITHIKDVFVTTNDLAPNSDDNLTIEETTMLKGILETAHAQLFPLIEGFTAWLATTGGNTIEDAHLRLQCKSFNSMTRLLDNIVGSKHKSTQQLLYGIVLILNIIITIKDFRDLNVIEIEQARIMSVHKEARNKAETIARKIEERLRQEEAARKEKEAVRRLKQNEQERQERAAEEQRKKAKENRIRNRAFRKPEGDPVRLAWEEVEKREELSKELNTAMSDAETAEHSVNSELYSLNRDSNTHCWFPNIQQQDTLWSRWRREEEENTRIADTVRKELRRNELERRQTQLQKEARDARQRFEENEMILQEAKAHALAMAMN